jgi:hypothetical protein
MGLKLVNVDDEALVLDSHQLAVVCEWRECLQLTSSSSLLATEAGMASWMDGYDGCDGFKRWNDKLLMDIFLMVL